MTRRARRRLVLAVIVAIALSLLVPLAAARGDEGLPAPAATQLRIDPATRTTVRGQLVLSAVLTTADGRPIGERPVEFYREVRLFGSRQAFIGTSLTDTTGLALLAYRPAQAGPQSVTARFAGDERFAKADARTTVDVRDAVPAFEEDREALAPLRRWLPVAVSGAVALTWLLLLGVLASAARGIRRASGGDGRPAGTGPTSA